MLLYMNDPLYVLAASAYSDLASILGLITRPQLFTFQFNVSDAPATPIGPKRRLSTRPGAMATLPRPSIHVLLRIKTTRYSLLPYVNCPG